VLIVFAERYKFYGMLDFQKYRNTPNYLLHASVKVEMIIFDL